MILKYPNKNYYDYTRKDIKKKYNFYFTKLTLMECLKCLKQKYFIRGKAKLFQFKKNLV